MTDKPLWELEELLNATGGKLVGEVTVPLNGVSIDSRTIGDGDIYVAIKGERLDGHDFAADALKKGAGLAIVSRHDEEMEKAGPLLVVDDPLKALEGIAVASRARCEGKIIAVTGSVGKTTTKDALKVALSDCGKTHASVASFNNQWGVPLTLARMARDTQYGIFEIGMNHAGEITPLVGFVRPHVAIITSVAESHLGHFASVEEIADAKAEIFSGLVPDGTAVLPADNAYYGRLREHAVKADVGQIVSFGKSDDADVKLERYVQHELCSCVSANVLGETVSYKLGSPGEHVVTNSLAVLAAVKLAGADLARAALALANLQPPKGRGERMELVTRSGKFVLIDESYNANPASVRAALALLGAAKPTGPGRRIAVLGDMLELGDDASRLHSELNGPIEKADVDVVYACGTQMRKLWDVLAPFRHGAYAETSKELLQPLLDDVHAGDVVMIKGSLGSRMGLLVDALAEKYSGNNKAA